MYYNIFQLTRLLLVLIISCMYKARNYNYPTAVFSSFVYRFLQDFNKVVDYSMYYYFCQMSDVDFSCRPSVYLSNKLLSNFFFVMQLESIKWLLNMLLLVINNFPEDTFKGSIGWNVKAVHQPWNNSYAKKVFILQVYSHVLNNY